MESLALLTQLAGRPMDSFYQLDNEVYSIQNDTSTITISLPSPLQPIQLSTTSTLIHTSHTSSNDLILCLADGSIYKNNELIATLDGGISAVCASWDEELLVVVASGRVMLLNRNFDVVSENLIGLMEEGAFVSLGWGKRETQFKGKDGKNSDLIANLENVDISKVEESEEVTVAWRSDSDHFTVSFFKDGKRYINIYSREAALEFTCEAVTGLSHVIEWNKIALLTSVRTIRDRTEVIFFEKNGLRHGEFFLPPSTIVKGLKWNGDETLLAVLTTTGILLYGMKNYHYYNRKSLLGNFSQIEFDLEDPLTLHTIKDNLYLKYTFTNLVYTSGSVVIVVDGCDLLISDFSKSIIPPPMSQYKRTVSHAVTSVDITAHGIAVLLCNGTVLLLNTSYEIIATHEGIEGRSIVWCSKDVILILGYDIEDFIHRIILGSIEKILTSDRLLLDDEYSILSLVSGIEAFQTSRGEVFEIKGEKVSMKTSFGSGCSKVTLVEESGGYLGLTFKNKLMYNESLLFDNCNSYTKTEEFVICVTNSSQANFQHLAVLAHGGHVQTASTLACKFDSSVRRVEMGSKVVMVIDQRLILEMPRGNLETVFPRALVLTKIRRCLDLKEYRMAFEECRRHRVDMNIMVDYISLDYKLLVKQVHEVLFLNLLVGALRDENVCMTMYPVPNAELVGVKSSVGKVNRVCEQLRAELALEKYTTTILTTFARQTPPALESAMTLITTLPSTTIEASLKHLIFLADVDVLYKVALGMYDFQLVVMVAQYSHKDPKEYLSFLAHLNTFKGLYRQYKIDDSLERYDKATRSLVLSVVKEDTPVEELVDYLDSHLQFKEALSCSPPYLKAQMYERNAMYQEKVEAFGEAGLMYELAEKPLDAVRMYIQSRQWKELIALCYLKHYDMQCLEEVCKGLEADRRFEEAGEVYEKYLNNTEKSLQMLTKGLKWLKALLLVRKNPHHFATLHSSLLQYHSTFLQETSDFLTSFEKEELRLMVVRVEKRKVVEVDYGLLDDTESMATTRTGTTRSTASSRTGKTSRQRRKQARKRASGRDKAFEDEFLLKVLSKRYGRLAGLIEELHEVGGVMARMEMSVEMSLMSRRLEGLMGVMASKVDVIFDTPVIPVQQYTHDGEEEALEAYKICVFEKPSLPVYTPLSILS